VRPDSESIAPQMALEQHVILKGLCEELDRACLHRTYGHGHVAVAGDEDDRHVEPFGELLL